MCSSFRRPLEFHQAVALLNIVHLIAVLVQLCNGFSCDPHSVSSKPLKIFLYVRLGSVGFIPIAVNDKRILDYGTDSGNIMQMLGTTKAFLSRAGKEFSVSVTNSSALFIYIIMNRSTV